MSYTIGPKRVVRNPITGEEIVYEKNGQQQQKSGTLSIEEKVKSLLLAEKPKEATSSIGKSTQTNQNKSEFMSQISSSRAGQNSSLIVHQDNSTIPMLNFSDLVSEDRSINNDNKLNEKIDYKQELANLVEKQAILNQFKHQNPLVNPTMLENSARPKSSYRYGYVNQDQGALDSPILRFQQQQQQQQDKNSIKTVSPLVSNLEAPRLANESTVLKQQVENNKSETTSRIFESMQLPKPLVEKKESIYKIQRVADLEKLWLESGGMTPLPRDSRANDEEKTKFLKEKMVVDTIVTDQLSKFPLSNEISGTPLKTIYTSRGNRHTIMDNHLRPVSSLSENQLSKKCKFSCRIRSPSGKLALRELFGLVFLYDGSVTIYEFRLLCGAYVTGMGSGNTSKKTTALPFLQRKVYNHAFGRRKGQQIGIWDLFKGSIIYFPNNLAGNDSALPETARNMDYVEIEVTDVDELEKENLLMSVELSQPNKLPHELSQNALDIKQRIKQPYSDLELNDKKILASVRIYMRKQIESRSVEVYMGLAKLLKGKSRQNSYGKFGYVSLNQLHEALVEYNVQIHSEDLNIAWQVLDQDMTGYLSHYTLLRSLFGEMNPVRHGQFRTLVRKLDTQKTGFIQTNEIYKYYRMAKHPRVLSGAMKEEDLKKNFLSCFELLMPSQIPEFFELSTSTDTKSPIISYEQFEEYYNGLSIVVDTDDDFAKILKNSWNLVQF